MRNPAPPAGHGATTVLWIDDHAGSLSACIELLRFEGVAVEAAASGTLGIELAATRAFDVILLDLRLPDLSGLEVLHERGARASKTPWPS